MEQTRAFCSFQINLGAGGGERTKPQLLLKKHWKAAVVRSVASFGHPPGAPPGASHCGDREAGTAGPALVGDGLIREPRCTNQKLTHVLWGDEVLERAPFSREGAGVGIGGFAGSSPQVVPQDPLLLTSHSSAFLPHPLSY